MTWRNNGRRISQPKVGWREVSSTGSQKTWENIVVIHFVGALHPSAPLCSGRLYVHHQNEAINPGGSAGVKHFDLKTDALHQNTRILLGKFRAIAIEQTCIFTWKIWHGSVTLGLKNPIPKGSCWGRKNAWFIVLNFGIMHCTMLKSTTFGLGHVFHLMILWMMFCEQNAL